MHRTTAHRILLIIKCIASLLTTLLALQFCHFDCASFCIRFVRARRLSIENECVFSAVRMVHMCSHRVFRYLNLLCPLLLWLSFR